MRLGAQVSVLKFRYSTYRYIYMAYMYSTWHSHTVSRPTVRRDPTFHPNDDDDPSDDIFADRKHLTDRGLPDPTSTGWDEPTMLERTRCTPALPSAGRREQLARGSSDLWGQWRGVGGVCPSRAEAGEAFALLNGSGEILAWSGHAATPSDWPNQNPHRRGGLAQFEQLHQSIPIPAITTCMPHPPFLHPVPSGCSRRIVATRERQGCKLSTMRAGDG